MRTFDVYEKYRIPPWLQLHQLRVAAVGKTVALMHQDAVDVDAVIVSCLLHDAGSIVKFDFSDAPTALADLYPASDRGYWQSVQTDMRAKYGDQEHTATDAILREIGVRGSVRDIVSRTGFVNMHSIIQEGRRDVQVVQYADMRVTPHGIGTLEGRITDVRDRYAERLKMTGRFEQFDENFVLARDIELRLFAGASLRPEDITDASIAPVIEELKMYAIS